MSRPRAKTECRHNAIRRVLHCPGVHLYWIGPCGPINCTTGLVERSAEPRRWRVYAAPMPHHLSTHSNPVPKATCATFRAADRRVCREMRAIEREKARFA